MQAIAKHRYARVGSQKARLVADQIRGKSISSALDILNFSTKKSAGLIKKVLESAIANAEDKDGADIDTLVVSEICIDEGPVMKRLRARAKGRGNRILKRTSHITISVSEE